MPVILNSVFLVCQEPKISPLDFDTAGVKECTPCEKPNEKSFSSCSDTYVASVMSLKILQFRLPASGGYAKNRRVMAGYGPQGIVGQMTLQNPYKFATTSVCAISSSLLPSKSSKEIEDDSITRSQQMIISLWNFDDFMRI